MWGLVASMNNKAFGVTAAILALGAAAPAGAATWISTAAAPCETAACKPAANSNSYFRVIRAADLAGVTNISSFLLDRDALGGATGAMFSLTFWTNAGEVKIGDFGHFMIDGLAGDQVNLMGREFAYDPAWGDLYVRVDIDKPATGLGGMSFGGGGGGGGGFAAPQSAPNDGGADDLPSFSSADNESISFTPIVEENVAVIAAPEPTGWALMIAGFGGAGAMLRRRRKSSAAI